MGLFRNRNVQQAPLGDGRDELAKVNPSAAAMLRAADAARTNPQPVITELHPSIVEGARESVAAQATKHAERLAEGDRRAAEMAPHLAALGLATMPERGAPTSPVAQGPSHLPPQGPR